MPKIPRSEQSVAFRSADMPFSTGSGYEAPGKALQQLGQGIANLGQGIDQFAGALTAERDKEDEFNTRLRMLKWDNEIEREDDQHRQSYTGDGEGYAAGREQWFNGRAQELMGGLSQKGQKIAALYVERKRNAFGNQSRNFEHSTRTQYRINATDGIIAEQFLDLQKAHEDELEDRVVGTLQGADLIINQIPGVTENQREALRQRAQQAVFSLIKGRLSDDKAADVLGRIAARAQEFQRQQPIPSTPGAGGPAAAPTDGGQPSAWLDPSKAQSGRPIDVAKSFLGASETRDTEALASFFRKAGGQKLSPADTAWCAAFVNAALGATGQKGTGTLLARDFLKFGSATEKPAEGDIVVLTRGDPNGWQGHVGFYAGRDAKGNVLVLGGNQGNKVSVQSFPASQVLGYRKPPEAGTKLPGIELASNLGGPPAAPSASPARDPDQSSPPAASPNGIDPAVMKAIAQIESGGNPNARTGSYRGLYQLSEADFKKYGGKGSINDPEQNAIAAGNKFKALGDGFQKEFGRAPTPGELYLMHQQGESGARAHLANPDKPAWENMAKFGTESWAKKAIWGNLTPEAKKQFGSVENVTSKQFVEFWSQRVNQGMSAAPSDKPIRVADASGRIGVPPITDSPPRIGGVVGQEGRIPGNDNGTRVAGSPQYQVAQAAPRSSVWSNFIEGYNKAQPALQAARIRAIEAQVKAFEGNASQGVALPDADMARLQQTVEASGDPELQARLRAGMAGLAENIRERINPPEVIQQRADALRAQWTGPDGVLKATPEQVAGLKYLDTIAKNTEAALNSDPLRHAEKVGILPAVPPLDPRLPPDQMKDVLEARIAAAQFVAQHYGREPVYFKKEELPPLTEMLRQGGKDMETRLSIMATALGPEAPRAFKQFAADGKDAATIASLGVAISMGNDPQFIHYAALGLKLKSGQNANFKPQAPSADHARSAAVSVLGTSFGAMPSAMQNAIDLTNLAYEGYAAQNALDPKKDLKGYDAEVWKDLFKKSIGQTTDPNTGYTYGGIDYSTGWGTFSGHATLLPPTIRQGKLGEVIGALKQEDLYPKGAAPSPRVNLKTGELIYERTQEPESAAQLLGKSWYDALSNPKPGQTFDLDPEKARNMTGQNMPAKVDVPEALKPQISDGDAMGTRAAAVLGSKIKIPDRPPIVPGAPYTRDGRLLSLTRLKSATFEAIGPGRYLVITSAMGDPREYVLDPGGPEGHYVLDLNAREKALRARRPDLFRPESLPK